MKKRSIKLFVGDILESINQAIKYHDEIQSEENFMHDRKTQDAIVRRLEIIGEATKNIPLKFRKKYPAVPWRDITGMRDKLAHKYFGVDLALAWSVIEKDLPGLKKQIQKIIDKWH